MRDLISRSALARAMGVENAVKYGNETAEQQHNSYETLMKYEIADYIEDAPAVDAAPVVHARWGKAEIVGYDGLHAVYGQRCSNCGEYTEVYIPRFCPNCGAKMLTNVTNDPAKPENCRYYTENSFWGGGCLGTKEIDVCQGENCERWKPKMDAKEEE